MLPTPITSPRDRASQGFRDHNAGRDSSMAPGSPSSELGKPYDNRPTSPKLPFENFEHRRGSIFGTV